LLVFLVNGLLAMLTAPDEEEPSGEMLLRGYAGIHRLEWPDESVEFHLTHGEWIGLLRSNGFDVERLAELLAPPDAPDPKLILVTADWARRWPAEEVWRARKRR
jgi:hypothetical protein